MLSGDTKLWKQSDVLKRRFFGKFILIFCESGLQSFSKEAVSILQLSQQAGISTVIGGWFNSKGKEQIIMIDSFFLVIKNEDSCENSRHDAVILMFL